MYRWTGLRLDSGRCWWHPVSSPRSDMVCCRLAESGGAGAEGNTDLIQKVSQITPVVPPCFYSENSAPGTDLCHLCPDSFQHHHEAFPGVIELEFTVNCEILSYGHCRMPFLVWVHPYYQIPCRNLPDLLG